MSAKVEPVVPPQSPLHIWVTGAGGFVGGHLCQQAAAQGAQVLASSRNAEALQLPAVIQTLNHAQAIAGQGLGGVNAVIHVAARAHQLHDTAPDPAAAFHAANVVTSLAVAEAAARAGARRLVFVSSIGVNGNATHGHPFTEQDAPAPAEPYAHSKLEAEQALQGRCKTLGLELVVVRPPLVYGVGAPGNFGRLLRLATCGLPLPLASVRNQRSFVAVENLCDFLLLAATHPQAAGELYLVSDGEDVSTPQLMRWMAEAAGKPLRLVPLPLGLLNAAATVAGQKVNLQKFCGSLQVNSQKARQQLGWVPPTGLRNGVQAWVRASTQNSKNA